MFKSEFEEYHRRLFSDLFEVPFIIHGYAREGRYSNVPFEIFPEYGIPTLSEEQFNLLLKSTLYYPQERRNRCFYFA